jgi:hypothetical protein
MNQSKMRTIQDVIEIMIVIVHLGRGELPFIHDVLRGQRTDVKAFGERTLYNKKKVHERVLSLFHELDKLEVTNMVCVACLRKTYSCRSNCLASKGPF